MLPSLLPLRPGVVAGLVSAGIDADAVRDFGVGRRLVRRLFSALGGRVVRRAIGLSSLAVLSPSSSAIVTRRPEAGVPVERCAEEPGVDRMGCLPRAGVAGDCIGLANGRLTDCCAGVVDAGRPEGGGDKAEERLKGLRTGMAE